MASVNEDENIQQEGTGRRTRSGRKVAAPAPAVSTRSTRRSSRKQVTEQVEVIESVPEEKTMVDTQSDIIKEMLAEAAQGVILDTKTIQEEKEDEDDVVIQEEDIVMQETEVTTHNADIAIQEADIMTQDVITQEGIAVSQGDDIMVPECDVTQDGDVITQECDVMIQESDVMTQETDIMTQGMDIMTQEGDIIMPETDIMTQETDVITQETGLVTQETEVSDSDFKIDDIVTQMQDNEENIITTQEDEKSSSFPFGGPQPSDNSDGKTEENLAPNIAECVDSSLLASLVGDNANSLPSAGEESQSKENFVVTGPVETIESQKIVMSSNGEDSVSRPAIVEDLQNGETTSDKTNADIDAEVISEDELPTPTKPKVTDAEEVSDDELPAPKRAELPADTEVVSEDELPSTKKDSVKRKASEEYNPSSPTEETADIPEKRPKLEEGKEDGKEKEKKKDKEKKKLPELDKYWKAVNDDPADFTGWTYLLQYVDQENDIDAAREAYDAFLAHYPYCYGYWRKYADYEKRKGNKKKCEEVFERGLKAIPLSVDLWIHYLTHVKTTYSDNEEYVRSQFERALTACGLEFRSDKLWEAFIKWELEGKRYFHVVKIYDRLLGIPTQGYNGHFDSFQDIINNHPAYVTVGIEEFKKLRAEIRESDKSTETEEVANEEEADTHVRSDEEMTAIKEKIVASRRKIHKATINAVTSRWTFEEGIKRPYFHVKPLERCQLKNWKEYLDFEIEKGDRKRILILFERCLIACALYDEFWLKLIRYLESQNDPELIPVTRDAFERACNIHHPDKPSLHLMWSAFEECHNNFTKAAEVLINLEKTCPNLLQIAYRRINLERRRGDFKKCQELYEHYISTAKNKNIAGSLAIKYARFCHKILGDLEKALNVLKQSLDKDPANTRIALQMIDIALQRKQVDEDEIVSIMDKFTSREGMDPEQKVLFAQRKVEFLEDFGSTAKGLQDAQRALQIALSKANEAKKKSSESSPNKKSSKDPAVNTNSGTSSSAYNNSSYGYGSGAGYYGNSQSYQSYDSYGYNHWQYGSGYSGYGQWSGYGNYY